MKFFWGALVFLFVCATVPFFVLAKDDPSIKVACELPKAGEVSCDELWEVYLFGCLFLEAYAVEAAQGDLDALTVLTYLGYDGPEKLMRVCPGRSQDKLDEIRTQAMDEVGL